MVRYLMACGHKSAGSAAPRRNKKKYKMIHTGNKSSEQKQNRRKALKYKGNVSALRLRIRTVIFSSFRKLGIPLSHSLK